MAQHLAELAGRIRQNIHPKEILKQISGYKLMYASFGIALLGITVSELLSQPAVCTSIIAAITGTGAMLGAVQEMSTVYKPK